MTGGTGTTAYIKPYANMTASSMSFTGPVQLQTTVTHGHVGDTMGTVEFQHGGDTLDALAAGGQGLTITAGTGNVSFVGVVGGDRAAGGLVGDGRYGHDSLYKA